MKTGTEYDYLRLPAMTLALAFAGTLVLAFLVSAFCDSVSD